VIKKPNRIKPSPDSSKSFKWWHIAAVIIMIAVLFIFLEKLKTKYQKETAVRSSSVESPAVIVAEDYSQKSYSSVRPTPARRPGHLPAQHVSGTLAVIVDDMGSSLKEAKELLSINMPMTFAIIPGLAKVKAVADAADSAGREVMVHLPMEPLGYPRQKLESNGLLVAHSEDEIAARTVELLNAVPHAKGANNHMGSRFTEQEEKMLPVLKVLKGRGQFFIDSRTTPRSTGYAVAERLGLRVAARNVFLDNQQDVTAIKKQLYSAAELSRRKGGVIVICHPHAATIEALKEGMPELQRAGITFVSAGELVR
jgi:polysaccharide deacetylase 2 family uncharacterized protein YibQ